VCSPAAAADAAEPKKAGVAGGIDRADLDPTVSPADNFYLYANGGWINKNPIPPGYPNWNTFLVLHQNSQEQCKSILEEAAAAAAANAPSSSGTTTASTADGDAAKVASFYGAAMDEEAIERDGIRSLVSVLDVVDQIVEAYQLARAAEADHKAVGPETWSLFSKMLGKLPRQYCTFRWVSPELPRFPLAWI
jgi:putative endopeptidase